MMTVPTPSMKTTPTPKKGLKMPRLDIIQQQNDDLDDNDDYHNGESLPTNPNIQQYPALQQIYNAQTSLMTPILYTSDANGIMNTTVNGASHPGNINGETTTNKQNQQQTPILNQANLSFDGLGTASCTPGITRG
eukprot:6385297-Ditylum_brightwellii.AAC.1